MLSILYRHRLTPMTHVDGMARAATSIILKYQGFIKHEAVLSKAVEESMACGIGVCMTCVLPVRQDDGSIAMKRSCIDGPVMDGANVAWEVVGKIQETKE